MSQPSTDPNKHYFVESGVRKGECFYCGCLEITHMKVRQDNPSPTNEPKTAEQMATDLLYQLDSIKDSTSPRKAHLREREAVVKMFHRHAQQEGRELVEALKIPCRCRNFDRMHERTEHLFNCDQQQALSTWKARNQ